MAENRISREQETRQATERKQSWKRPELLPSPAPSEEYAYHWVRISTLNQPDALNYSSKRREGWEPVKAADHPEIEMIVAENSDFKDNVVIGGLMLCRAPKEMVEDRNKHYRDQARAQMQSVDNNLMRENDPRMPLFNERTTKVTFGKGS